MAQTQLLKPSDPDPGWVVPVKRCPERLDVSAPAAFRLHARFTPGAGRIHFRPIGEEGKIRIAYVGGKIRPDV
ncbi:hypothetical protein [Streptomyces sp. NPDC048385]|uniref:hypothetical protein n=1 Tax=unclassified Streptomyces TaxID=2593676 RepID=UPI003418D197